MSVGEAKHTHTLLCITCVCKTRGSDVSEKRMLSFRIYVNKQPISGR